MHSIRQIGPGNGSHLDSEEFWKKYDAGEFKQRLAIGNWGLANGDLMPSSGSGHSGTELARSPTRCDLRFFLFILAPVFDPLRGGGVSV